MRRGGWTATARAARRAAALGVAVACAGCGATTAVRPLGAGNAEVHASLGGPLVRVDGTPIATPVLMAGGGFGATDRVDVSGDVDVTAAVFGVAHVSSGLAYHPVLWSENRARPAVTVAETVHVLTTFSNTRVAPQTTAVAAWKLGAGHLLYVGADCGVVFGSPLDETRVLAGPLLGGEWKATPHLGIALEAKWLAPYYDVAPTAPDWLSPDSRGYLSILLGFRGYLDGVP